MFSIVPLFTCLVNMVADVKAPLWKARQAFAMLRPVWKEEAQDFLLKNVKRILLYEAEPWRIKKVLLNKIQVFVMCLGSTLGIRWAERIANEIL